MGRSEPTHLVVGRVQKPHGVKGELFVRSHTDHPGEVFSPGVVLLPGDAEGEGPDLDRPPLRIETIRPFRDGFLVYFGGVSDRTAAEAFRGLWLLARVEDVAPLEEGELFHHQLRGLRVVRTDGTEVGTVREVYDLAPSSLLELRTPRGVAFIPYRAELVVDVDLDAGTVVVDPPEGLLEVNE